MTATTALSPTAPTSRLRIVVAVLIVLGLLVAAFVIGRATVDTNSSSPTLVPASAHTQAPADSCAFVRHAC